MVLADVSDVVPAVDELMPKVLYITYDGLTDPLGQSQILAYLIRLSQKGHIITILSFEKKFKFTVTGTEIQTSLQGSNIRWIKRYYTKYPPVISTIYDVLRAKQIAKRLHRNYQFDIIHCRGYITALVGLYLKQKFQVRFIFDMRGFWADEKKESGHWNKKMFGSVYNYFKQKERQFFQSSDYVVTLTNKAREEITGMFKIPFFKLGVVPTCVDFTIFKPYSFQIRQKIREQLAIAPDAHVLVYSGSLGGNYDINTMTEVFLAYQERFSSTHFLVLSKDSSKKGMETLTKQGIKNFSVLNVPFRKVSEYLMAADVGLVIYGSGYSIIGRSPTKLSEYWASGLPVLMLENIGDVSELASSFPEGLILIKPDLSNLKQGIAQLTTPPKDLLRSYAEDYFHIDKGVTFYDNVYTQLNNFKTNQKILYLTYDGLTDPLGQSQILPYIVGLSKYGYQFTVLSFEKKIRFAKLQTLIQDICDASQIQWVPITYTKSPPVLSTIWDLKKMQRKVMELHKLNNFDAVHCRSYITSIVGLKLKQKFGIRFIFDMRGFWADERVDGGLWNLKNPVYNKIYQYFKVKEKKFLQYADAVVSLTENGKREMLNWEGLDIHSKIYTIPCCVDMEHFSEKNVNNDLAEKLKMELGNGIILSYIGSIGTWYMLEEMLDFFKELLKIEPDAKMLFVTPESKSFILKKATEKDIPVESLKVVFAQRKEVPTYIAVSDYSLFFIKPVFSKKSSSPTKHGEIMSMGVPIICNARIGDVDAIVENTGTGLIVRSFSKESYQEVINKIRELKNKKGQIIREACNNYYSLEEGLKKYKLLYETVLQ